MGWKACCEGGKGEAKGRQRGGDKGGIREWNILMGRKGGRKGMRDGGEVCILFYPTYHLILSQALMTSGYYINRGHV